ncbi:MAG: hypothetical protein D6808_01085 [Candidatus Dadabacteria bacterium]|nr:MAG: hypothetical protein D6808_01085 [Candidatus Dadabacteria bacterium]
MNYRKAIISLFTFAGGVYFFLEFLLPAKLPPSLGGYEFGKYHTEISRGFIAIGSVAFGLGLFNLLYVHGLKVIFKRRGFLNSLALLVSMFLMMYVAVHEWVTDEMNNSDAENLRMIALFSKRIVDDYRADNDKERLSKRAHLLLSEVKKALKADDLEISQPVDMKSDKGYAVSLREYNTAIKEAEGIASDLQEKLDSGVIFSSLSDFSRISKSINSVAAYKRNLSSYLYDRTLIKRIYDFLYKGVFIPLGSAMFSLLGFYIISAGYRAFRIRNTESVLMMVAAVVVMLGQIPFYVWISSSLPSLRLWLLEVPSAAAFRAIKFGAAIASLYMAVRMWFSIESTSFADKVEDGKSG